MKQISSSSLLRYTDSDCPFGIFKLFLTCSSHDIAEKLEEKEDPV
jgi:hypothetical protein